MLLDSSTTGAPSPTRRWYRPERAALPDEPGRLLVNALVNEQRHARGRTTAGDDRLEARVYAMKRALWRLAHAERSAHFACSIAQLTVAIAPAAGWDPPPRDKLDREQWVRAHRVSVIRWLDWLQAAGILAYSGERDNRGQLWRTLVSLHSTPEPAVDELELARRRLRRFRYRAQRRHLSRLRRRRRQLRRRPLTPPETVLAAAVKPQRRTRRQLARRRAFCVGEQRRATSPPKAGSTTEDVTYPFGAPSTTEYHQRHEGPTTSHPAQTHQPTATSAATTGAGARSSSELTGSSARRTTGYRGGKVESHRDSQGVAGDLHAAEQNAVFDGAFKEPDGFAAGSGPEQNGLQLHDPVWVARAEQEMQDRRAAAAWRREHAGRHAQKAGLALLQEPAGRFPGLGRLRSAWVLFRFGLGIRAGYTDPQSGAELLGDAGSAAAGAINPGQRDRAAAAIAAYDANAAHRPPGWPATGTAALCALASQQVAHDFHSELGRLEQLTRRMHAAAHYADPGRIDRARRRAERRWPDPAKPRGRFAFRTVTGPHERPRFETPEGRRERVRDALLLVGEHPGLSPYVFTARQLAVERHLAGQPTDGDPIGYELPDGLTARVERYKDELRLLHTWQLPAEWADIEQLAGLPSGDTDAVEDPEDWTLQ